MTRKKPQAETEQATPDAPAIADLPPAVREAITPTVADGDGESQADLPASVWIEAPLGPLDAGYLNRHVEARLTTGRQQSAMRRLLLGLKQAGERLADGKLVDSNADAVRWMLEQIAAD